MVIAERAEQPEPVIPALPERVTEETLVLLARDNPESVSINLRGLPLADASRRSFNAFGIGLNALGGEGVI